MMAVVPEEVSPEQLAELDASYKRFPAFADWTYRVDQELWERQASDLETLKSQVSPKDLRRALDITMRTAAFDTGAIEGLYKTDRGLTITVAQQTSAWESRVREQTEGEKALELFKAQLEAYELVMDVATQRLPVTEAWIRSLHEVLTTPQETYEVITPIGRQVHDLPRGEYKHHPNHVRLRDGGYHAYAPVNITRDEMARLVAELSSPDFNAAHPVIQAAYAHYSFVLIHPFADGNGRVARALASIYLYRSASVPLLVLAEDKDAYLTALEAADAGDREPFSDFVLDAAISAVRTVSDTLRTALAPDPTAALNRMRALITAHSSLTHQELDQVANTLIAQFAKLLSEYVGNLDFPSGVEGIPDTGRGAPTPEKDGFRGVLFDGPQYVGIRLRSSPPAKAQVDIQFHMYISKDKNAYEIFVFQQDGGADGLAFTIRDAYPTIRATVIQRMTALIERTVGAGLESLSDLAALSLEQTGY